MTTPSCIEPQTEQKCSKCKAQMPTQGWHCDWSTHTWPEHTAGHEGSLGWRVLLDSHGYDMPHAIRIFCPKCRPQEAGK